MPSSLKDIFNQLKVSIVGTKTSDIDANLDAASKDIISYRAQSSHSSYVEIVKNLITKSGFSLPQTAGSIASGINPAAFGQSGRLSRYRMYESITGNIPYCSRALQVLVDNILSPDDITKISLDVKPAKYLEDDINFETNSRTVRELIEKTKVERSLNIVAKNTIQFGDFFCEIADDRTTLTSKSAIIAEGFSYLHHDTDTDMRDEIKIKLESRDFTVKLDYTSLIEAEGTTKTNKKGNLDINNIHLLFYDPKRIIKLQSIMFPICFGYLVFPVGMFSPALLMQEQVINTLCQSILQSLEKKIPEIKTDTIDVTDLKDVLKLMIRESDISKSLNIRYVSPDKMVHFNLPSTKYYPYGESVYDPCVFTAKVLIALETALTLHRINRSIEKRKISVEVGLPRDASKAIERLKEDFNRRKFSLDSFGSIDTISSNITSFEDIYLPMKDGKTYVDIAPFQDAGADVRGKVDELKFLRDQVVASLGVPSSYIGIEENTSTKATLSEESVLFARTIVNHQKFLSEQIQELIKKIYVLVDPEKAVTIMDDVIIAFPTPRSLQYELEAKHLGDLANLVQVLETIGVPREWSKKKYLTSIDWDEVKKYEIDVKIDTNLKAMSPSEIASMAGGLSSMDTGMGGGGMMGGDMSGLGPMM